MSSQIPAQSIRLQVENERSDMNETIPFSHQHTSRGNTLATYQTLNSNSNSNGGEELEEPAIAHSPAHEWKKIYNTRKKK